MNEYTAGSTSLVEVVDLMDSASTVGAGKTGLAYNTASLTCYYKRSNGSASVPVTLVNITTLGTFVSGGFKEIDATNQPGSYEFHPPNAAFASGAKWVTFYFVGAAGMVRRAIKCRILAVDPDDPVRQGMTGLPNIVQGNAGALITSGTGTAQLDVTGGVAKANLWQILGTLLTETVGGYLAAGVKKFFDVATPVHTVASVNQTGDSYARLGAPAGASIAADVAAVKTDTGNLVSRITSTLFSGITSLGRWLGAIAGKTADSTTQTEIRATVAGASYDITTDSQEAIRDRGDGSWVTGPSAAAISTQVWSETTRSLTDKAGFKLASDGLALVTAWTVNVTGNLSGSVGSVTGGVTVATNNDKTGYSLATAPPTAGAVATAVWAEATRSLTDKAGFTISGTITTLDGLKSGIDTTIGSLNDLSESDIIDAINGSILVDSDYLNRIADHVRRRQQPNVEASSDGDPLSLSSEYGFIQQVQESAVSGNLLTVKKTDGTTTLGTKTIASDANADPIVSVS